MPGAKPARRSGLLHGVGWRRQVAGAFEVGAALQGFGRAGVLRGGAEKFQLIELLGRHEAAWYALGGLVHEAIP